MYRIYSQINCEKPVGLPEYYDSLSEANRALRSMAASQAQKMGVESYISAIRDGKYKPYRKSVADGLTHFFLEDRPLSLKKIRRLKDVLEEFEYECNDGVKEIPEDFLAVEESGAILCFDFFFAQKLHLEFGIDYYSCDEILKDYIFLKDITGSYKFMIEDEDIPESEKAEKLSNSANIYFVYRELLDAAVNTNHSTNDSNKFPRGITAKQISEASPIFLKRSKPLSLETVVNHINALKDLGIPIITYTFSKKEAEYWAAHGVRNTHRYEIDLNFMDKVPDPVDACKLKAHVNPLLVLFVLKSATKPMRQEDIINAIQEKYNVKLNRQAVSRHIKLLIDAGEPIEKRPGGYIYAQKGRTKV